MTVAALYVQAGGVYTGLDGVDPWPESRDARLYAGPWPVIAHPPCARWGHYWFGSPSAPRRMAKGDDGDCFAAALMAVRTWGGVLEHPEASHAWAAFTLNAPPRNGGWVMADFFGGWTCCVEQGHYGHRARKATWLYACGVELQDLKWGPSPSRRPDELELLSKRQRAATPIAFRDVLIRIAESAAQNVAASPGLRTLRGPAAEALSGGES